MCTQRRWPTARSVRRCISMGVSLTSSSSWLRLAAALGRPRPRRPVGARRRWPSDRPPLGLLCRHVNGPQRRGHLVRHSPPVEPARLPPMQRQRQRQNLRVAAGRHMHCLLRSGSLRRRTRVSPGLPLDAHRQLARAAVVASVSHESLLNARFGTLVRQRRRAKGRHQLHLLARSPVPCHRSAASPWNRRQIATRRTDWRT